MKQYTALFIDKLGKDVNDLTKGFKTENEKLQDLMKDLEDDFELTQTIAQNTFYLQQQYNKNARDAKYIRVQ